MAAQIVLKEKQSTYGGPYGFYTVTLTPSERTANSVKIKCEVSAHLQYANSETQLGVTCTLHIGEKEYPLTLVPYGTWWRGTAEKTKSITFTLTGLDITQTKVSGIRFSALEGGGATSGPSLTKTACADLGIDRYGGVAHVGANGAEAVPWVKVDGVWRMAIPWVKDSTWKVGV